jgi:hypothetical protein
VNTSIVTVCVVLVESISPDDNATHKTKSIDMIQCKLIPALWTLVSGHLIDQILSVFALKEATTPDLRTDWLAGIAPAQQYCLPKTVSSLPMIKQYSPVASSMDFRRLGHSHG